MGGKAPGSDRMTRRPPGVGTMLRRSGRAAFCKRPTASSSSMGGNGTGRCAAFAAGWLEGSS